MTWEMRFLGVNVAHCSNDVSEDSAAPNIQIKMK